MKKKLLIWATISFVIIFSLFNYLRDVELYFLPKGDLINTSSSPNNTYTFNAYLVNAGGATGGFAIRGELKNNLTGKTKNIYWDYSIDYANITWLDETTIIVNEIKLDVTKDKYHFRKHRN